MSRMSFSLIILLLIPRTCFGIDVWSGERTSAIRGRVAIKFSTGDSDILKLRMPLPTMIHTCGNNTFDCSYGEDIRIYGDGEQLNQDRFDIEIYNDIYENKGGWLQVYVNHDYDTTVVEIDYRQLVTASAFETYHDICLFNSQTNYCRNTRWVDQDNAVVLDWLENAVTNYMDDPDIAGGVWGLHEAISKELDTNTSFDPSDSTLRMASSTLSSGGGDCMNLTNALVAIHRRARLPSRPATGIGFPFECGIPTLDFSTSAPHCWFEGWDGYYGRWFACDPHFSVEFVSSSRIWFGSAEDIEHGLKFYLDDTTGAEHVNTAYGGERTLVVGSYINEPQDRPLPPTLSLIGLPMGVGPPPPNCIAPGDTTGYGSVGETARNVRPNISIEISPNPFSSSTRISYDLPSAEAVELKIYGVDGRLVKTLVGSSEVVWDGTDEQGQKVSTGIYFARLQGQLGDVVYVFSLLCVFPAPLIYI